MRTVTRSGFLSCALAAAIAGLFGAPARAEEAVDSYARQRIDALVAAVSWLENAVAQLQARVAQFEADTVPDLGLYVSVVDRFRDIDGDGVPDPVPTVLFEAANVQIVAGSGRTVRFRQRPCVSTGTCPPSADNFQSVTSGLGNLIVGYDEPRPASAAPQCSDGLFTTQADCEAADEVWAQDLKSGSHNLALGPDHFYSQLSGVAFGERNVVNGVAAVVLGGFLNTASGNIASVSGGVDNAASGFLSTVGGGDRNTASGRQSSVSGGIRNDAAGIASSVSGGTDNIAGGDFASVGGGASNTASGFMSSVVGGASNEASGVLASVSGGARNEASGDRTSATGGNNALVSGNCNWGGEGQVFGNGSC